MEHSTTIVCFVDSSLLSVVYSMPRFRSQGSKDTAQLSLTSSQFLGLREQDTYPNDIHTFKICEDDVEEWIKKRLEMTNWRIEELRKDKSTKKKFQKQREREGMFPSLLF